MNLKTCTMVFFLALVAFFSFKLSTTKSSDLELTNQQFILSSGSMGGNYYNAGQLISNALNKSSIGQMSFNVISSNGSIDNINRLKARFADLAIVQRDVLLRNFYGNGEKLKNISIISPLFQEKFLIYTQHNEHISFESFKTLLQTSTNKTSVGVTSKTGVAYKTFGYISELLSLPSDKSIFIAKDYQQLIQDFKNKKIDYLITFSLPLHELEQTRTNKVFFSDSNFTLLENRLRYFSKATIDDNPSFKTLGVWALLVGLNKSIDEIGDENLLKNLQSIKRSSGYVSSQISSTLHKFQNDSLLFDKYLSSLPVTSAFLQATKKTPEYYRVGLIIFSIILIALFYIYRKRLRKFRKHSNYIWIRYNHIMVGVTFIVIAYLLCIEYLILIEQKFYIHTGVKSRTLDLTRMDLHIWNVVRIFAGNDDGVFPFSLYGKLAATLSTYIVFFGALTIAISEYLTYKLIEKRRGGLMTIKSQKHVVISGWSIDTPKLIKELIIATTEYHQKTFQIVCVVHDPIKILESNHEINLLEREKQIVFIKGDIRNRDIAKKCNVSMASSIILLAEDNTVNSDEKTLLRALSISKFNRLQTQIKQETDNNPVNINSSVFKKEMNRTYIIAEVNNEEFIEDLKNAGVNGIVNRGRIIKGILVQSLLNPGVSKLLNNVLTFSEESNEFYTIDLRDENNSKLRYKTFDELILPLRKQQILLLAIKVVYLDETGKDIVDEEELSSLLEKDGLVRQIITNPINQNETAREADDDDQLLVLAASTERLLLGLKKVNF